MDESTAVQMKMVRMMMLCDNLCTRVGYGANLTPSEALAYKQLLDFVRQHARIMELHLREGIIELENEMEQKDGDDHLQRPAEESQRDEPASGMVDGIDRPTNPRPGESEEDDVMGSPAYG